MHRMQTASAAHRRPRGFTLLELMIAVAIVAIVAAIAYPSYQSHLISSRRAAAQSHLMDIAQNEQQYYLNARSYAATVSAMNMTTPSEVSSYYTISIAATSGAPPTFTATATPITGTSQATDGALSINNSGVKTSSNNSW
ncbi:type IV pilin protein [Tolumonas lignilytica]|uniref:type IV pilin protein n=1 Tax=Tolumonas lignilytica TaxID=1283284 RepID=UPI0004B851BE|nr:type IV pilin protein [Tolumonas lignilytica]